MARVNSKFSNCSKTYCLQMGKESIEQYHVQDQFQESILKMEKGIAVGDKNVTVKSTLSCNRKSSDLVFGNGGAFCDLCTQTKEECEDVENIRNGVEITKTVQDLWQVYETVKDPNDENEIIKRKGDYDELQSLCHKPTVQHETHSYQIFHASLCTFDTFICRNGILGCWSGSTFKKYLHQLQEEIAGIHLAIYPYSVGLPKPIRWNVHHQQDCKRSP